MKKLIVWIFALAAVPALLAQNITGSWQGSLQPAPGRTLRIVFKISRADDESLKATIYSIDQGGQPIDASSATLQGSTLKVAINAIGGGYEGKLNGDAISGTWTQGGSPMPLNLDRATPATAWTIPEPPPPPKQMAADANPSFEVATIKPSDPASQGASMLVGRGGANLFTTTNSTLSDLITFAYGLHARQVTGGPSWMETEKYDINAKPDQPGIPNVTQLRTMVQKLIADRFALTFHHEKKDLSVYAITVAKTGSKLSKSQSKGNLPGFGGRGPGAIGVQNSTMAEFAEFLQSRIVDHPVVDQTALTDRFDFQLKWTPDNAIAPLAATGATPAAPNPDDPPDLFTAFQQQLGLKLEAAHAPVDVLVIDKVEKPSAN